MTGSLEPAGGDGPDPGGAADDPSRGTPEDRMRALGPGDAAPPHGRDPAEEAPGSGASDDAEARVAAELASLPSPPLPAGVLARIDRALARERARPAPAGGPAPRRGPGPPHGRRAGHRSLRRVLLPALAAAALLVAVALAVAALPGTGSPTPTAAPAPSSGVVLPSAPPGPGTDAPALRRADLPRALRAGLGATDAGPLSDPRRLAACLAAQPVPAAPPVVGARRVVLDGTPGVLLLLPTGVAARFRLLVVGEGCGRDGPATLADTVVGR